MHRIDNATAAVALPTPAAPGTAGYFTEGSPSGGVPATVVDADWLNALQEEILYVITQAGITPTKGTNTQLAAAIATLVAPDASDTVKGKIEIATEAEILAAASALLAVTPGRMKRHPGVAKKLVRLVGRGTDGACTIRINHGGTARAERIGTGCYRVLWSTSGSGDDMPGVDYVPNITIQSLNSSAEGTTVGAWGAAISGSLSNCLAVTIMHQNATGIVFKVESGAGTPTDPALINIEVHNNA